MMKLISITFLSIVALFAIIGALIKTTDVAPPHARIIVDHSLQAYVAPPCFNDADVTNDLEDTTLGKAVELGYKPESECTESALVGEPRSLLSKLLELLGFIEGQWTKDGEWNS